MVLGNFTSSGPSNSSSGSTSNFGSTSGTAAREPGGNVSGTSTNFSAGSTPGGTSGGGGNKTTTNFSAGSNVGGGGNGGLANNTVDRGFSTQSSSSQAAATASVNQSLGTNFGAGSNVGGGGGGGGGAGASMGSFGNQGLSSTQGNVGAGQSNVSAPANNITGGISGLTSSFGFGTNTGTGFRGPTSTWGTNPSVVQGSLLDQAYQGIGRFIDVPASAITSVSQYTAPPAFYSGDVKAQEYQAIQDQINASGSPLDAFGLFTLDPNAIQTGYTNPVLAKGYLDLNSLMNKNQGLSNRLTEINNALENKVSFGLTKEQIAKLNAEKKRITFEIVNLEEQIGAKTKVLTPEVTKITGLPVKQQTVKTMEDPPAGASWYGVSSFEDLGVTVDPKTGVPSLPGYEMFGPLVGSGQYPGAYAGVNQAIIDAAKATTTTTGDLLANPNVASTFGSVFDYNQSVRDQAVKQAELDRVDAANAAASQRFNQAGSQIAPGYENYAAGVTKQQVLDAADSALLNLSRNTVTPDFSSRPDNLVSYSAPGSTVTPDFSSRPDNLVPQQVTGGVSGITNAVSGNFVPDITKRPDDYVTQKDFDAWDQMIEDINNQPFVADPTPLERYIQFGVPEDVAKEVLGTSQTAIPQQTVDLPSVAPMPSTVQREFGLYTLPSTAEVKEKTDEMAAAGYNVFDVNNRLIKSANPNVPLKGSYIAPGKDATDPTPVTFETPYQQAWKDTYDLVSYIKGQPILATETARAGTGGSQHLNSQGGTAIDIQLSDPVTGQRIQRVYDMDTGKGGVYGGPGATVWSDYDPNAFRTYEDIAQTAKSVLQNSLGDTVYSGKDAAGKEVNITGSQLADRMRWGGYFNQGVPLDLMHTDFAGPGRMYYGNLEQGLYSGVNIPGKKTTVSELFPGIQSVGLNQVAPAQLVDVPIPQPKPVLIADTKALAPQEVTGSPGTELSEQLISSILNSTQAANYPAMPVNEYMTVPSAPAPTQVAEVQPNIEPVSFGFSVPPGTPEYTPNPYIQSLSDLVAGIPANLTDLLSSGYNGAVNVLSPYFGGASYPPGEVSYPIEGVQVSELGPIAPPPVVEQPPVPPQQVAEVTPSTGNYFADLLGSYTRGEGGGQSSTQPRPPTMDSSYYMNLYNDRLAQGLPPSMEGDDPAYLAWLTQYLAGLA